MGSHRARHRADQNNSEELATDLLARLADEVRPPSARTRHAAERPALDPFSTAPFPARTPAAEDGAPAQPGSTPPGPNSAQPHPAQPDGTQPGIPRPRTAAPDAERSGAQPGPAQQDGPPLDGTQPGIPAPRAGRRGARQQLGAPDAGAAEGGGARSSMAAEAADHRTLGLRSGPAAELSAGYGYGPEPAGHVPAPRFPSDPGAPFPLEDAPAGLMDAPRTGRERLAALGRKPIYAAVSATMITAAVAATAGPAVVTPPPPTPDRSPSLAAAALDLAPPAPQADAPAAVQVAGGPAVLAPGKPAAADAAPVLGSTIAAQAAADAKAYAEAQARQAAGRPGGAPQRARPEARPQARGQAGAEARRGRTHGRQQRRHPRARPREGQARRPLRVGRRGPERLRLLRSDRLGLQAARGLAPALLGDAVDDGQAGLEGRAAAR